MSLDLAKNNPVLVCRDLSLFYRDLKAVDGLNGTFDAGSLTAIIGPNGGGKSTLLKAIKGLLPVSQGHIDNHGLTSDQIAYLPQSPDIDRSFPISVGHVVSMGLCSRFGFFSKFSANHQQLVEEALESVGLQGFYNKPISGLSGGQFQRVLFARISLQKAKVILLDEPFAAIDAPTMEILAGVLQSWQQQGCTVITVLHDLDIVRDFFPSTLVLARSAIAWGKTKEVLTIETLRQAKFICSTWDEDIQQKVAM